MSNQATAQEEQDSAVIYRFLRSMHRKGLHIRHGSIEFDTSDLAELLADFHREQESSNANRS